MTVKEYCSLVGVSKVAVNKRLRTNNPPKAIKSWRKFANTYELEINAEELRKLIEKKNKKATK